jgi:hypothetical protein
MGKAEGRDPSSIAGRAAGSSGSGSAETRDPARGRPGQLPRVSSSIRASAAATSGIAVSAIPEMLRNSLY